MMFYHLVSGSVHISFQLYLSVILINLKHEFNQVFVFSHEYTPSIYAPSFSGMKGWNRSWRILGNEFYYILNQLYQNWLQIVYLLLIRKYIY